MEAPREGQRFLQDVQIGMQLPSQLWHGAFPRLFNADSACFELTCCLLLVPAACTSVFTTSASASASSVALQTGAPAPLIAEDVNDIIQRNAAKLDAAIDYQRDFE